MQLHQLQPTKRPLAAKRIGRGGKRGKTSGRGHKGQLARAGNSTRPEARELIKKIPKLRGHGVSRARAVNAEKRNYIPVNVSTLERVFGANETVSPQTLVQKGVISVSGKRTPLVKILGQGELQKSLSIKQCSVSASARAKVNAAGGSVA